MLAFFLLGRPQTTVQDAKALPGLYFPALAEDQRLPFTPTTTPRSAGGSADPHTGARAERYDAEVAVEAARGWPWNCFFSRKRATQSSSLGRCQLQAKR